MMPMTHDEIRQLQAALVDFDLREARRDADYLMKKRRIKEFEEVSEARAAIETLLIYIENNYNL